VNSFCNYSDLPSLEWWEKLNLIELTNRHIRKDLHDEVELIITLSNKSDLSNLEKLTKEKKYDSTTISSICIELDFLATKLKYFKKLDGDTSFGLEFDLVPDLIAKWRDEKIDNIL
jgi:hypothetical protein